MLLNGQKSRGEERPAMESHRAGRARWPGMLPLTCFYGRGAGAGMARRRAGQDTWPLGDKANLCPGGQVSS
jgi:hypothetical protein